MIVRVESMLIISTYGRTYVEACVIVSFGCNIVRLARAHIVPMLAKEDNVIGLVGAGTGEPCRYMPRVPIPIHAEPGYSSRQRSILPNCRVPSTSEINLVRSCEVQLLKALMYSLMTVRANKTF
jgi:hypothetical protein